MADMMRLPLRIVFYREDGAWVAHCLEFDLMGDGDTQQEAVEQLCEAIVIQIEATVEHKNPSNLFCPADGKFFEMFAAGKDVAVGELKFQKLQPPRRIDSFEIEDCKYREYIGSELCAV